MISGSEMYSGTQSIISGEGVSFWVVNYNKLSFLYINTDSQVIPSATYAQLAIVHSEARVHAIPFVLFCKLLFYLL